MGHPGQQAHLLLLGDGEEVLGRVLFEDAVDDLATIDVALFHAGFALFKPADVGTQGGAVVADFALVLQRLQGLENVIVLDGGDARVVQLVKVNVVGVQPAQGLLAGETG